MSKYRLINTEERYAACNCNLALIYSEQLEDTKEKTCQINIKKEKEEAENSLEKYKKRLKCKCSFSQFLH